MRPLALAALLAATALPAAAQPPPASAPAQAPSSLAGVPRTNGGGYGGMHAPASPQVRAARQAMRQQCQADMARLCADVMQAPPQAPAAAADGAGGGGGRAGGMMQCVRQHRSEVSPACAQAMDALRAARMSDRQTAPAAGGSPTPQG